MIFNIFYKDIKDEAEKIQLINDNEILNYGFNNNRFFWSTFKKTPSKYDFEKILHAYITSKTYYRLKIYSLQIYFQLKIKMMKY